MRWYADNSELSGNRGAPIPDILLFGGVAVPCASETALRASIERAKGEFGETRFPAKWNFKDLKRLYIEQGQSALYERLLDTSKDWRKAIFEAAAEHEFRIIIACIEAHAPERKSLKTTRDTLAGLVFNNGLMRFALHVQEHQVGEEAQVVLDWPDKALRDPFDNEYACAYARGLTKNGISYHSGPLKNLGFLDSVSYTNMARSTLLQFADLVVGATRELVEVALEKRTSGLGVELLQQHRSHFRGHPTSICGKGISVDGRRKFESAVKEAVERLLALP